MKLNHHNIHDYNKLKLGERMRIIFLQGRHLVTSNNEHIKTALFSVNNCFVEVCYNSQSLEVINVIASRDVLSEQLFLDLLKIDHVV